MPISQSTNLPVRTIGRPPDDEWLRVKWTEHSLCARPRPPSLPLPLRDPGPDSLTPHSRQHAVSIQILPLQGYCMRHKVDRRTAQKGGARGGAGTYITTCIHTIEGGEDSSNGYGRRGNWGTRE